MLDWERFEEVFVTLRQNKLRALLTAAGVFWGAFLLVAMLGFGNGLQAGVEKNFGNRGADLVYIWGQRTTKPFGGLAPGRGVRFFSEDGRFVQREVDGIQFLAPRAIVGGWGAGSLVVNGDKSGNFGIVGDHPEYPRVEALDRFQGRFINPLDMQHKRKVAVIGQQVRSILFGKEDPLGCYIQLKGVYFQVVGSFNSERPGDDGVRANTTVHIPFSTMQTTFNGRDRVGWFAIRVDPEVGSRVVEKEIRRRLMDKHHVDHSDERAIGSYNAAEEAERVQSIFSGIRLFTWFVSVVTLLAGVLGVSNILLISVRERTREFGIRKALGASPASIVFLVVQEAAVLTTLAGYVGVVVGVLGLELSAKLLRSGNGSVGPSEGASALAHSGPLGAPSVDIQVALIAALVIAVAGIIAGIMPAQRAAGIRPVEALRAE